MLIDEVIAVSLPFVLAAVLRLVNRGVPVYAERIGRYGTGEQVELSDPVKRIAVNLAFRTYSQLSYVFSLLASSVTCISLTILSARPALAALGAAALLCLMPFWIIRWEGLSSTELQAREGRPMRVSAWITILALWAITLYARFYPASS